jgi:hypothetical protein
MSRLCPLVTEKIFKGKSTRFVEDRKHRTNPIPSMLCPLRLPAANLHVGAEGTIAEAHPNLPSFTDG